MSLFSERMGFTPVRSAVQVRSMDKKLRNGLWNVFSGLVLPERRYVALDSSAFALMLCTAIWRDYFKAPVDEMPVSWPGTYDQLKDYFFQCPWFEVYDFLEFVARNLPQLYGDVTPDFIAACNPVLKKELSAYRFVGAEIAPITSEEEIAAIEEALDLPAVLSPVSQHLARAVELLADRVSPDYRNSVKESISAVEALAQLITCDTKATLVQALKVVEDAVGLHGALKAALGSLYGYTSDAEGIRHALLEEPTLGLEDAQFMLVACPAFVNYLVEKACKAGILDSNR
jgi:hypothetical protein